MERQGNRPAFAVGGLSLLFFLLAVFTSEAQDANYWTQQYGAYSNLLSGSVIGSASDLSAVYYNPGRLSINDTSAFIISAKAYQYRVIVVENASGEGSRVSNPFISGSPDLVAGNLPVKKLFGRSCRMAYSFLQRYQGEFDVVGRNAFRADVLPDQNGVEFFAGEAKFEYKVNDFWGGLSWSTALSPKWGVGITQFISFRSQRWDQRIIYEALLENGNTATANRFQDMRYNTYNVVWRIGLSGNLGPWRLGLSVTTPYVRLFGNGNVLYNELIAGGDQTDDLLVADQQLKQKARWRSPWSVGLGGSLDISSSARIHLSAEWFAPVQGYDLIDTEPFTGQSNDATYVHRVFASREMVLNGSVGVEFSPENRFRYYGSFATDFSAVPQSTTASVFAPIGADLYHLGAGTSARLGRVDLNLGLVFSFGASDIPPFTSVYVPPGWGLDSENVARIRVQRIKLIFGLTLN